MLLGLSAPEDACVIARARLAVQLCARAPFRVSELFEAVWNLATPWGTQLTDACRMVLAGCRGWSPGDHVTLPGVRRWGPSILKACKHLSRYGSAYRAFTELWAEITSPRVTHFIGVAVPRTCCLCSSVLPSAQALAAHIHRKHSVVNCLTQFTCGTVCLWCNVEHHSTDRLKYHLRHASQCLHGLRIVVGSAYIYGSGTKRKGRRGHVGLPPVRVAGPINATPAQRRAALEGRICTEHELPP